jgi:hypothetical protein
MVFKNYTKAMVAIYRKNRNFLEKKKQQNAACIFIFERYIWAGRVRMYRREVIIIIIML